MERSDVRCVSLQTCRGLVLLSVPRGQVMRGVSQATRCRFFASGVSARAVGSLETAPFARGRSEVGAAFQIWVFAIETWTDPPAYRVLYAPCFLLVTFIAFFFLNKPVFCLSRKFNQFIISLAEYQMWYGDSDRDGHKGRWGEQDVTVVAETCC